MRTNRIRRLLGATVLGGTAFLLWTGTATAEPDVEVTGTTVAVDDPTGTTTAIDRPAAPAGLEATTSDNDIVIGQPGEPAAADPSAPTSPVSGGVTSAPASTTVGTDDITASAEAPQASAEPDAQVCGNAVGVVGDASASCRPAEPSGPVTTSPEPGAASVALGEDSPSPGTTADADLPAASAEPEATVCGNGAGVLGVARGDCASPASSDDAAPQPGSAEVSAGDGTPATSSAPRRSGGGTQTGAQLPAATASPEATACGNGAGVLGDGTGGCGPTPAEPATTTPAGADVTAGDEVPAVAASRSGAYVPVGEVAPAATVCGNGAGIVGDGTGGCTYRSIGTPAPDPMGATTASTVIGGDTPLAASGVAVEGPAPASDPSADVCGNGIGIAGDGAGGCSESSTPAAPLVPVTAIVTVPGERVVLGATGEPVADPSAPTLPVREVEEGPVRVVVGNLGDTRTIPFGLSPVADPGVVRAAGTFGPAPTGVLGAAGHLLADLADGTGALVASALDAAELAALAVTGFGIRDALSLASLLLALGGCWCCSAVAGRSRRWSWPDGRFSLLA